MVASAIVGAVSSSQAASAQEKAANEAQKTQMSMYDQTKQLLSPFVQSGQSALPSLNNLLSGNAQTVQSQLSQLPGYQFTLNQGLQSVQNGAAARGLGTSGAALRGAADYTTGLANSTFGDQVNRLLQAASLGENAAAQTGNFATQTGQGVANTQIGAGNAAAAGDLGVGSSITNWLQQAAAENYLMQSNKSGLYSAGGPLAVGA